MKDTKQNVSGDVYPHRHHLRAHCCNSRGAQGFHGHSLLFLRAAKSVVQMALLVHGSSLAVLRDVVPNHSGVSLA